MSNALPPTIADYLRRVVVRARRRELIAGGLWAAAVFGAWGLAACGIDRVLHLSSAARMGLLGGGAAMAIGVLLWPTRRWRRRIDWVAVAEAVEADRPGFGQRLVTIVSRLLGPAEHRGSEAMVAELLREVDQRIADDRSPKIATRRGRGGLVGPMLACAAVIAAAAGMLRVPGLELPRLAERFVLPWRPAAPVTTTQLIVRPAGDSELADSAELRVDVVAEHVGDGVVSLFTQSAGEGGAGEQGGWSRLTMDQLSPGRFEYLFAGLDRDLRYYVAGGDAVSPVYTVRLLRKPAVSAYHIRYRYPAFVRRGEATVTNSDGQIEAPVGTAAEVMLTATEPLESATLHLGGPAIAMSPASDPATFSATIRIEHDQIATLDLLSTRKVAAQCRWRIRALPIRPPVLWMTDASPGAPGGVVLNADPRQVLPVAFEAEDDYGLQGLSLGWRINGRERRQSGESAVAIPDGVRHLQDTVDFDLATLPLRVGDVLTVWLEARNTAGLTTVSQPIEVLLSVKPVDAQMRLRLAAMDAAAGFADRLAGHVSAAASGALGDPGENPAAAPRRGAGAASESTSAELSSATEDAGLLRQALLRVIAQGAPAKAGVALAYWVDAATVQSYWADRLFQQLGDNGQLDSTGHAKLNELATSAKAMRDDLLAVDQGWWASASLAKWDDVKSSDRPGGVIARVRQDAIDDAKAAGCADGADLPLRLAAKTAAADATLAAHGPVDFVPAAQEWAVEITRDPQTRPALSQRLRSAAEAEALRQNGDLPAARDWELASQAADALQTFSVEQPGHAELSAFAPALSALQQEQRMDTGGVTPAPAEQSAIRQSAASARMQMEQWARLTEGPAAPVASSAASGATGRAAARVAESAAIAAAAAAATHVAPATRPAIPAIAVGPALAAHMQSNVTISQKLATAQQIDAIDQKQQDLLKQTSIAQPAEAPSLAQRQQQVADSIATVAAGNEPAAISIDGDSTANARQRESATLLEIGQQLAQMPQQLAAAQSALNDAAAASARADAAKAQRAKLSAGPTNAGSADLIRAAQRSADESSADADDASHRLAAAMPPVSVSAARAMGARLAPYAPEASAAQSVIDEQLAPALADFEKAIGARDAGAADRAGGPARDAIAAALQGLASAQDALAARDPLVTAGSSARAAVASLRHSPPDFSTAIRHQTQVTLALSRAWDQSIHGAAAQRLAAVPGLQPLFASSAAAGPGAMSVGEGGVPLAAQVAPMIGEPWGRLPGQTGDTAAVAGAGDSADPPGFEDALRLYFEALGRAQKEGK